MCTWIKKNFIKRPIVLIEDGACHINDFLKSIDKESPQILNQVTVLLVMDPCSDAVKNANSWIRKYEGVQVAYITNGEFDSELNPECKPRVKPIASKVLNDRDLYAEQVANLVRHDGVVLHDVDMEPLRFLSRHDHTGISELLISVRGRFPERPPVLCVFSNKIRYAITAGDQMSEMGIKALDKDSWQTVIKEIKATLSRFPLRLQTTEVDEIAVGPDDEDAISRTIDLVIWPEVDDRLVVSGKAFKNKDASGAHEFGKQVFGSGTMQAIVWRLLFDEALSAAKDASIKHKDHAVNNKNQRGVLVEAMLDRIDKSHDGDGYTPGNIYKLIGKIRESVVDGSKYIVNPSKQGTYFISETASVGRVCRQQ
jgi:hypothetical protein